MLQAPFRQQPSQKQAWAFVVGIRAEPDIAQIEVRNLSTGMKAVSANDGSAYTVAFVDLGRRDVVSIGDELQVGFHSNSNNSEGVTIRHVVGPKDIIDGYKIVDVNRELPRRTALGQNFPNPFNPETWIPYQLREDTHVVIAIYAPMGELVRILDLGYKPAGFYGNRSKAAYWDGRNSAGEMVSSGIYFYCLRVENFSAQRKLVIVR